MNRQIQLFVFVTLLVAIILPASCATEKNPRPAWDSYSEFGFTFKYPPELNLKAADTATAEEGSISSIKARENGKLLHLRWTRGISGKQLIAKKVLSSYIRSRAPQLGEGKLYLGESKWLKVHNQQRAFARFYTSDEKGIFLNVAYAWYAEDSNRTFVLCCGATWEHPVIITDGSRFVPEWPKLDDDPSYDFCQGVLESFKNKLKRSFKHSERSYSLSVKGTVTREPYPRWASLTSKRMAYLVQAEVKNIDERPFCFDCVKGTFHPDSGTPFVIENRIRDANEQEVLEITLSSGQDKEWQFGTDGYTQDLLAGARGKTLKFSLTFFLKDEVAAGPYFTTLPDIKKLPISVGAISVGGKKCSLAFSKSLKSAPAQIRLYKQNKIAFGSNRDGNFEIYVMNADGSEQKRLTNNSATDTSPSWSPHGKKIAFASEKDGNPEIYIMNADGSEQKRLTNNPASDGFPSWSTDGKKIAFQATRDGNGEIYLMNADGSNQKRLTNNPANDGVPSWSPDGKKIAFRSSRDDGNDEIYVMNADGSEQKRLTNTPASNSHPSWSPDGRKIAFNSYRDGNPEIYVMNTDGSEQKRLTNNSAIDGAPSWSPDGKKIAFTSQRDGNVDIYLMNADGSKQKRLTSNPAYDMSSSWSPFLGSEAKEEPKKEDRLPKESVSLNCLKIKYLDLSEKLIYDWSFRYFYLEYDSPPPKGYWYSLHGRENEKEKMSHTLYLINEGRRVQLLSDQIDRFRMKWKKRKIPSQREEGNLERTSLLLLTIDGGTFELDYNTDKYWTKDISPFADKDKYHTNIHLYIVGKERKNDQLIDYSLNLGYDRSILFGHDPSKIPVEIAVIKTESGTPNSSESLRLHKQIKKNLK